MLTKKAMDITKKKKKKNKQTNKTKPQQFYINPKLACYVIKNRIKFGSKLCCSLKLKLYSNIFLLDVDII